MSRAIARLLRPSRRIRAIRRFRSKNFLCLASTPSRGAPPLLLGVPPPRAGRPKDGLSQVNLLTLRAVFSTSASERGAAYWSLQRRRSPARAGGAASGPVPVGGAEEWASRSPAGPGTWDLAPRAMAGKGRRCGARTGGDGLARRASSSSGSGASRAGPQLPRPRRFHAQMPALWRDTVSRGPGNRA